jgi:hypothetical protein
MLQQPISDRLKSANTVLLSGAGGGYDLVGAVPLLVELRALGKTVHLASLTFTDYLSLPHTSVSATLPNLASVTGLAADAHRYCPEAWLSRWLEEHLGYREPIWLLDKTGVGPLRSAYEHLASSLTLDALVLVDGGIDVVLRGDETSIGTPGEDLTSLAAIRSLPLPAKLIACLGMGSELRDGICHEQFLGRVAQLTTAGGYLGAAALCPSVPSGSAYVKATDYIVQNQVGLRQSHVQHVVRSAAQGAFGPSGPDTWLNPLLALYWFFDAAIVADTHLFLSALANTGTALEVSAIIEGFRKTIPLKPKSHIPL